MYDNLEHLRSERLRVWEQAKALIDRAHGRTLTVSEQLIWDDLNKRLCHLDNMLYRNAGSTNTTHWSGASGPPVSAGGGGGSSYYGFNRIQPSERDAYMRGVHQGQEIIKAISEGLRAAEAFAEAAELSSAVFASAKAAAECKPLDVLPAERTCTACGIGEYSRIGAGPFGRDGICRYCAELNALAKPAPKAVESRKLGGPKLWPLPARIAAIVLLMALMIGAGTGIIVGIISAVQVVTGH